MPDYGTDIHCTSDLDSRLSIVGGLQALTEALARRLSTTRGSLFYDPEYGTNILQWLDATSPSLSEIRAAVERECLKDERVDSVTAVATFADDQLTVNVSGFGGPGPFDFTLAVSRVTSELLSSHVDFNRP